MVIDFVLTVVLKHTFITSSNHISIGSVYSTVLSFNEGVLFTGVKNPTDGSHCVVEHITNTTADFTCSDLPLFQSSFTATLKGVVFVQDGRSYPIEVTVPFSADYKHLKNEPVESSGLPVFNMCKHINNGHSYSMCTYIDYH